MKSVIVKRTRATEKERRAFFEELDALGREQKRQYEATRRRRLREFGRQYKAMPVSDPTTCYYCTQAPAKTQDHCPSLLALDSFGIAYFHAQGISLLLVPACMSCNNAKSGQIVFRHGRMRPFSWEAARKRL